MKLYHVSFGAGSCGMKNFIPRVPNSTGEGEDKNTARICLTPSVEKCIQAVGTAYRWLRTGERFTVYEADISLASEKLTRPDELNLRGLVPDSMENEEYWYLSSLTMKAKRCEILSFCGYHDIAWSCVNESDMLDILENMLKNENPRLKESISSINTARLTSFEIYSEVSKCAGGLGEDIFIDDFWDTITELPWAQIYKIDKIDYMEI